MPSFNPVLTIPLPSTDLQLGLTRPAFARQHDTLVLYDSFESMFPLASSSHKANKQFNHHVRALHVYLALLDLVEMKTRGYLFLVLAAWGAGVSLGDWVASASRSC